MERKRVMIIDGLNLFIRNYIKSPIISTNGQPMGGTIGYLRSLQKCMREIKPDEVIIVWDGPGGSRKRKSMMKGYKAGRSPLRLNRNVKMLSDDEEMQNKIWQQLRLVEYLNNFPVLQIMEEDIEADDLIAFVSNHNKYKDWVRVIVSLDKDFIQLCSGKTILFRPEKSEVLFWQNIVEEYGIHPNNFALARSMEGDKSDNIKGLPGVGMKSVKKYLPFLSEEKTYYIGDIEKECQEKILEGHKTKFYKTVVENISILQKNYSMMQLSLPNVSPLVANKIRNKINNFVCKLNETGTKTMLLTDGMGHCNFDEMMVKFRKIVADNMVEDKNEE